MSGVAAGELRHKVDLQTRVNGQDPDTGAPIVTWETVARPWAKIAPMSGREFLAAAAEQSEVRGKITIRYRGNVDATYRVVYRGVYYNILAVLPDAESGIEHLTLMTAEGVRLDQ